MNFSNSLRVGSRIVVNPIQIICYPVLPFVAFKMNWAISSGCETSDAWLELSEIVVAFIRCANIRWASGGIMWSPSDTSNHVGSCFQAGGPDGSVKSD